MLERKGRGGVESKSSNEIMVVRKQLQSKKTIEWDSPKKGVVDGD